LNNKSQSIAADGAIREELYQLTDYQTISCRQTVERKIPVYVRVIQYLLYFTVLICTILGAMWGALWLVPSLGSLFLAWYMMGEARVSYEYQLEGRELKVLRTSGMRSKQKTVDFVTIDLKQLIVMAQEGMPVLDDAEAASKDAVPKRITYDVSAHDEDKGCYVLYAMGVEPENGRHLKVFMSPNPEIRRYLRLLCPGKVHVE